MNVTTEKSNKLNQADLLALLPTGGKAKVKAKPTVKADKPIAPPKPAKLPKGYFAPDTTAFTGPMLPMLGKASKNAKRGVFADMGFCKQRIILDPTKATLAKYGKVATATKKANTNAIDEGNIGLRGEPIREKIRAGNGESSKAVIWLALEQLRLANNGQLPPRKMAIKHVIGLNLMCRLRGTGNLQPVNPNNVSIEVWAYMVSLVQRGIADISTLDKK